MAPTHPQARYCALAEGWEGEIGDNGDGLILGEEFELQHTDVNASSMCKSQKTEVHGAWLDSRRKARIRCSDAFTRSSQMSTSEPRTIAHSYLVYASGSNR